MWGLWALTAALLAVRLPLMVLVNAALEPTSIGWPVAADALSVLGLLAFSTLGALIVARQPRNAVGWLFLLIGFLGALGDGARYYARYALEVAPGTLPAGLVALWLHEQHWRPYYGLLLFFLPLLFPTGRPISPRWAILGWFAVAFSVVSTLNLAFLPGPLNPLVPYTAVENPFGLDVAREARESLQAISAQIGIFLLMAGPVSLIVRFRRSRGVERQQIKWLAYFVALASVAWIAHGYFVVALQRQGTTFANVMLLARETAALGLPIAAGIAILRYRLYDIDLLINRTLVYGALTAMLGATYAGSVVLLQALLRPLTGGSELAVAGSTLGVAALFRPLRDRIQRAVDRRFYRSKYDAAKTIGGFSSRLRQQIDLDQLSGELVGVVRETMQPRHVSLWLRALTRNVPGTVERYTHKP